MSRDVLLAAVARPSRVLAAIGGLAPAATCHVVLHELAHVLAPGFGHGREWRYAARQVGLMKPRAWPDAGELGDWGAISPGIRARLQAIAEPTERVPAEFWERGMGREAASAVARGPAAAT